MSDSFSKMSDETYVSFLTGVSFLLWKDNALVCISQVLVKGRNLLFFFDYSL